MPILNLTQRPHKVLIDPGTPSEVDLSDYLVGDGDILTIDCDDVNETGFNAATATMRLDGEHPTFAFDPRKNNRLRPGLKILVQVQLRDGTWINHPRGALRLTAMPKVPHRAKGEPLELALGCELEYANAIANRGAESELKLFDGINDYVQWQGLGGDSPTELINRIGSAVGIGATLVDAIPGNNINRVSPKQDGSQVERMAEIALVRGLHFLWCDGDRNLRATPCNLSASPLLTLDLNADVVDYEFSNPVLPPADDLVVATRSVSLSITSPADDIEDDEGLTSATSDPWGNPETISSTQKTRKQIFPNTTTSPGQLITDSRTTVRDNWGANDLLASTTTEVEKTEGAIARTFETPDESNETTTLRLAERKTVTYFYNASGQVEKIRTVLEEPEGTINAEAPDSFALVESKREVRRWQRHGSGWKAIKESWDARTGENQTDVEINEQVSPPAPKTRAKEEVEDGAETGESSNEAIEPPRRKRVMRLKIETDSDVANDLAQFLHKLEWGAALPLGVELPVTDYLLQNYYPFFMVDFLDEFGDTYRYLLHQHSFNLTGDGYSMTAEGLFMGVVENGVVTTTPWDFLA